MYTSWTTGEREGGICGKARFIRSERDGEREGRSRVRRKIQVKKKTEGKKKTSKTGEHKNLRHPIVNVKVCEVTIITIL